MRGSSLSGEDFRRLSQAFAGFRVDQIRLQGGGRLLGLPLLPHLSLPPEHGKTCLPVRALRSMVVRGAAMSSPGQPAQGGP